MKVNKTCIKIMNDAFSGNITKVQERVDKILAKKVNNLLNKRQTKLFNKIFSS